MGNNSTGYTSTEQRTVGNALRAAVAFGLVAACAPEVRNAGADPAHEETPHGSAEIVILNARVHTMNGYGPAEAGGAVAGAVCIEAGAIVYVGDDDGAAACVGPDTQTIDAAGRVVLPGLIDSHSHVIGGSISVQKVNLSLADTMEKLRAALAQLREDNPGDGVIYARGWQNHLFLPDGPRAAMLDEIFGDRPVILGSVDGHSHWFSSKALELGGASAASPDPHSGVIYFERDPETGALLGTAREGAGKFIIDALVSQTPADFEAALLRWMPEAAAAGLTSVFDAGMGAPEEDDAYALLAALEARGALSLRLFTSTADDFSNDDPAARLVRLQARHPGAFLRPVAVKLFADGVPEAHTAYLTDDYIDRPGFRSEPMTDPERLYRLTLSAQQNSVPVHVHAIGGAAVKIALDAIERAQKDTARRDVRHAIAHMDLVDEEDVPRFAELGVIAQTSIQWATRDPSYDNIANFVGAAAMEAAYPVRTLIEAGAVQTFGADWPAASYLSVFEPLTLIEVAVTRQLPGAAANPIRNPAERLTVAQAVAAMTREAAYQLYAEKTLGTLEVGKRADMVMLDQDIFAINPHDIHRTKSALTIVDGRIVHEAL